MDIDNKKNPSYLRLITNSYSKKIIGHYVVYRKWFNSNQKSIEEQQNEHRISTSFKETSFKM